ncbi:Sodium/hydrogen exchanger family-domain-containing protein [Naematelia encephala]|uniref:Sodium/hydrogen exchanger family-domain-containing protein n=1 Tax=Naematelia encephala TaxID=71784 RepID=A0A1Y2AHN9_9TREE|nr:Sodium/hydrogen exchanger family-domain-containing protein [Naematelia encephala]
MGFDPFEVTAPHLAYAFLGGFVVLFGMFSLLIKERLYIGEAPIAVVVGIVLGPYVLGLFDPGSWGDADQITLEFTRVVIAISVFAVGVELPKAYMKRHWRSLFFLLGPCMIYGWMVSALLMWGLIPGYTFLSSLLVAAAVTPTDPILAQAVIGGKFADKHVPAHIRHLLSAESGSNDGAAFPFLGIALYLSITSSDRTAVGEWFYYTISYEVLLGIIIGAILGFVARKLMQFAERKRFVDRQSYVAQYVSLAVMSIGITSLLGSDDLLSAFACGCAFAWDGFFNKATEDAVFSNVIDLLFNCAAFIYIGAILPFDQFNDASLGLNWWRLFVLAILILLVRRLPAMLLLYKFIPDIKTFREAAFTGWFGPMGVGAIFIITLARTELPTDDPDANQDQITLLRATMIPVVSFLVLSSVISHGLSIPFFSLSRRVHSITYTWSRNPSMDTRRDNEPAWTTHARRVIPGQEIVINRDDDAEEGDLGLRRSDTIRDAEAVQAGKIEGSSGGSSSSRTMAQGEDIELTESPQGDLEEERQAEHDAERDAGGERAQDTDDEDGSRTPPLAEYREGNHLVVERKKGTGDEVEVEVIRNHFHESKEPERTTFDHPRRLLHGEVDKLLTHLPKSIDHAVSRVMDEGKNPVDHMGLGLMHSNVSESSHGTHPADRDYDPDPEDRPRSASPRRRRESHEDRDDNDNEVSGSRSKTPKVRVEGPGRKIGPLRRLFGLRRGSVSGDPSTAEQGRAGPRDPALLSPPTGSARARPVLPPSNSDPESTDAVELTRTASNSLGNRSIRFAPDSSLSSDTAPGPGNYGNANPGFNRNPSLAMFRTGSIKEEGADDDDDDDEVEDEGGPSVSFKLPSKWR